MTDRDISSLPQIHMRMALLESELERAAALKDELEARGEALLGRFMMEQIRKTRGNVALFETLKLTIGGVRFSDWLTRDEDRQLFGLSKNTPAPERIEPAAEPALSTYPSGPGVAPSHRPAADVQHDPDHSS